MKKFMLAVLLAAFLAPLAGCVVYPAGYYYPYSYGYYGYYYRPYYYPYRYYPYPYYYPY